LDEKYMKIALEEAKKAYDKGEVPIGAIIVRDDEIIGRGYNLRESLRDATAHAEILAIQDACKNINSWRLTNTTLYVTIEPCAMCCGAIVQSRIKRLVFGASDPKGGATGSIINILDNKAFNHQVETTSGVLEVEASDIMKDFFRKIRKNKMER